MTRVPPPRFDLLKMQHYMFGSLQFSRGCPFQCEFCDIIVTFGRRPRLKTSEQVVAELDALRAQKVEIALIVDDNLIGNKQAIKPILRSISGWQRARGYPFTFFTEASLDLAEDAELMQLMVDANIQSVFVGIESPNEDSLRETRKFQNVRPAGTLADRVRRIQEAGLEVWCGMIVGFDHDTPAIFAAHEEFLQSSRILHAMIGMLHAIPKTPLYARLAADGRLDPADHPEFGTNVIPLHMSREELRDGYLQLMESLYEPQAYFRRLEELYLRDRFQFDRSRRRYWRRHPWTWFKAQSTNLVRSAYVYRRLMQDVPDAGLRREYRARLLRLIRRRPDPAVLFVYLIKCAMHFHHHAMVRDMRRGQRRLVNTF